MLRHLRTFLASAVILLSAGGASANDFPNRFVKLVVGFPPGGASDTIARIVADGLSKQLGQSVVVENKPGAGANIAATTVARAEADGYTLLLGTAGTNAINKSLYANLPYDHLKDFAPIGLAASSANVLIVNPNSPAKSIQDFIDLAKKQRVTIAIPGNGSTPHLTTELLKMDTGITLVGVPYRGGGPGMTDVIAGKVDALFEAPMSAMPHIKSGAVKALGISSKERNPTLPDVPAFAETVANFEATAWWGVFAPVNVPKDVLDKLRAAFDKALESEDFRKRLGDLGADIIPMKPDAFQSLIESDTEKWAKVVKAAGIKVE